MTQLNSSDLAKVLGVSKGRVSQYVSGNKLDGCFTGSGTARRFDLDKVAHALGRQLHPGQMLGNGASTKRALKALEIAPIEAVAPDLDDDEDDQPAPSRSRSSQSRESAPLEGKDPDRYELARTQKAEEEARRLRRMNAEAEGTYVLASEVERQVARLLAQEVAEVEAVLRDGSRRVADLLGVDFKAVRQAMMNQWREHRAKRTEALQVQAEVADASADELAGDI